jgi:hypothetical protein
LALLGACSTISGVTGAVQTPAQLASDICPPVKTALAVLTPAAGQMTPAAQNAIDKANFTVAALCSPATAVKIADVQNLQAAVFPALQTLLAASNLPNKQTLALDLALAQGVLNAVVQNLPNATPALSSSTAKVVVGSGAAQ